MILHAWDTAVFRAIHLTLHHSALDPIMMALTSPGRWKIPLLVLVGALFLTQRLRGVVALLVLALTLAVSDQVSAKVIKPIVKRTRPSVVLADSRPLFGVRRSYSFPSVHAVNFSAALPIVATVFPPATIPAVVVTTLVCLSRIYVGDHWPSDVAGGIVLGLGLGLLGRKAFLRLEQNVRRWISQPGTGAGGAPSAVP